jgi:hypothetical protein
MLEHRAPGGTPDIAFLPPISPPERLADVLRDAGHAVLDAAGFARFSRTPPAALADLRASWDTLPPDRYLRDGGRYRRRRHASFVVDAGVLRDVPARAHWQPVDYNALHGGLERWFDPVDPAVSGSTACRNIVVALASLASALRGEQPWFVEAHQFRIDTTDGIGRPTPEGAHRDGVDLVAVVLVARAGIKGGETRVFDADGPGGVRFTLFEPWSCLLLDDARVIHESTPIQPLAEHAHGWRDTLVVTLRSGGFQDPVPAV